MIKSSQELRNKSFLAKYRWLLLWTSINLIIFLICFMNYKLQLKHRYLYKILKDGLSFSRAAAMVINFNLLLVWLPMCKYTLTKIAYLASESHRKLRLTKPASMNGEQGEHLLLKKPLKAIASLVKNSWINLKKSSLGVLLIAIDNSTSLHTICAATITIASVIHTIAHLMNVINFSRNYDPFLRNLNMAQHPGQAPIELLLSIPGITGILMLLILGLMTFSSLAKVRSKSFNKFQFIHRLSIPFVVCLLLHPMTHVLKEQINIDRHDPELCDNRTVITDNLSMSSQFEGDATRIFSTTKKPKTMDSNNRIGDDHSLLNDSDNRRAQNQIKSNEEIERHEFVLNKLASRTQFNELPGTRRENETASDDTLSERLVRRSTDSSDGQQIGSIGHAISLQEDEQDKPLEREEKSTPSNNSKPGKSETTTTATNSNQSQLVAESTTSDQHHNGIISIHYASESVMEDRKVVDNNGQSDDDKKASCLDANPLFVAQSSICWYVLAMGLPCYLIDLFLRKWRRSKSSIQLLGYRSDCEGNLIELILSNNHKRFEHWQPGQFIYLNCPQIAHFEWHPFTISSMDNLNGRFTLHIKTAGDWTSELRKKLISNKEKPYITQLTASKPIVMTTECQNMHDYQQQQQQKSMICLYDETNSMATNNNCSWWSSSWDANVTANRQSAHENFGFNHAHENSDANWYYQSALCKTTDSAKCLANFSSPTESITVVNLNHHQFMIPPILCNQISCDQKQQQQQHQQQQEYAINLDDIRAARLDLFIDGPFHSPFERLLEQQVSVCIANGVGWTAFSSIFHNLISNLYLDHDPNDWWSKWRNFAYPNKLMKKPSTVETSLRRKSFNLYANDATHRECRISENLSIPRRLVRNSSIEAQIHMMIIVQNIDQLRPFFLLALSYFKQFYMESKFDVNNQNNPIREISAFLTRAHKEDSDIREFCNKEHLNLNTSEDCIIVNEVFRIYLGKPQFDDYLTKFSSFYNNKQKIAVYCCGSNLVKKTVRDVCKTMNRELAKAQSRQVYSYHEENF